MFRDGPDNWQSTLPSGELAYDMCQCGHGVSGHAEDGDGRCMIGHYLPKFTVIEGQYRLVAEGPHDMPWDRDAMVAFYLTHGRAYRYPDDGTL